MGRKHCINAFNLDNVKHVVSGKELTLSQTTNFRLFQTKRIGRRQFKFDENGRKFSKLGRKHWKKWKLLVMSNFSSSHNVFKRQVKTGLVLEWVNSLPHNPDFQRP